MKNREKKLLIVVDYQNDFVTGSLGYSGAEILDDVISEKITRLRNEGYDIAFTYDTHDSNYLNTNEGKNLPVEHCIKGTFGHELYGKTGLAKEEGDRVFYKETFGSKELFHWLSENEYDVIELCGLVVSICVISNAVIAKTALPEAEIFVDAKATGSNDKLMTEKALDVLQELQVTVLNRESNI
ncbi:MAG: cysteine hydrolase [Ruminococcaceae bacterium]|nr:cysteine hydrolase [Oscillospiraceae bacterium]